MRGGTTPYGYAYLDGQLVRDPKEYKIVQEIYRQWDKGLSFRAISRFLNGRNYFTRRGSSWKHELIKKIIERHEQSLKKTKGETHGIK